MAQIMSVLEQRRRVKRSEPKVEKIGAIFTAMRGSKKKFSNWGLRGRRTLFLHERHLSVIVTKLKNQAGDGE